MANHLHESICAIAETRARIEVLKLLTLDFDTRVADSRAAIRQSQQMLSRLVDPWWGEAVGPRSWGPAGPPLPGEARAAVEGAPHADGDDPSLLMDAAFRLRPERRTARLAAT